ncbi:leucyl aminopeptidase [Sphingomonas naphthae]|uniref:Probable cytosol aminopeptidase n=1 Tax=Sphingomonas naphthae TaxID=1813468 RepID=A0ABY7TQA5_9SPHN|nr:leucyl aminopeptidase [Sphingomonas naphthae]WCT75425.1 leucyl aminopeptidase [Sphingomonas naphthae]
MDILFADTLPADAVAIRPVLAADAAALPGAAAFRFAGKPGTMLDTLAGDARTLTIGVGEGDLAAADKLGSALVARLLASGTVAAAVDLSGLAIEDKPAFAARVALAARLRSWRHDVYRTKLAEEARPTLRTLTIVGAGEGAEAAWADGAGVSEGVAFTRTLVAEPANIIYPESFVARAKAALEGTGVEIEVLGEAEMREAGMGALLGVSQGSDREAQLLVMKYDGSGGTREPVALVGKGVTFDTGGISLKPPAGMEDMKWDMGGAGAVAGTMLALARRKAKAHVVGICGLVENMPSGGAQRPGDVVTTMSGQTVEVINTDAEGRLVLCDAITWTQKRFAPKTIVDLATLTGAMIISLGHEFGGIFSNDDSLAAELTAAATAVGEPLWRMPMADAFDKMIDSPIADMKNVGPREGGSITAAQFIKRYVDEGVRWAHLDIAGMVWSSKPGTFFEKGATGYGVRLLDRFIADNFER